MNNCRKRLEFKESSLKQEDKAPFAPKNVVHLFIVYEFGNVKIIKNADSDILIQDMELYLILVHFFQLQILIGVKIPLLLELI